MRELDQVMQVLRPGEENAINAENLQNITGLCPRVQRFAIQTLREKMEVIILSGTSGYWLPPKDKNEAIRDCGNFAKRMKRRAITSLKIARATEAYIRKLDGQYTIDDIIGGRENEQASI
jgi:hypothetical protein